MQRTIRVQLNPTPEQMAILLETMRQHTECFNAVAKIGYEHQEKNGVRLHQETYYDLRKQYPDLPSQLVVAARMRATESVKSALTRKKNGLKASCPKVSLVPIRYDQRSYSVKNGIVSLATIAGRQKMSLEFHPHAESIREKAIGLDSADCIYRKGKFWLHVVVTLPDVALQPSGEVVGVDMGLKRPAVTSRNQFLGERRWKEVNNRYFRLKRSLQAKGTRSAKRHLRRLAGKVNGFRRDCDHVLSRRIVDSVEPGTVIAIEDLTNIRKRKGRGKQFKRALHSWSFAQLRSFLEYKAEEKGCKVETIDPRYTSQTCSKCGYVHKSNRPSQSLFKCKSCGFELNADLNASRNIAQKYLAGSGKSAASGLLSTSLLCPTEAQTVSFR
jgi:putative transposase